jgi:hypothetical protein
MINMLKLKWIFHTSVHKFWILLEVIKFSIFLIYRGIIHDFSKYSKMEVIGYSKLLPKLKGTTYGSEEYKDLLKQLKPILDHHYQNNRHHPEFFKNGIKDMSLYDVVEMYIDWKVSCKKHSDGNLEKSLVVNKDRFKMSEELYLILKNTYDLRK